MIVVLKPLRDSPVWNIRVGHGSDCQSLRGSDNHICHLYLKVFVTGWGFIGIAYPRMKIYYIRRFFISSKFGSLRVLNLQKKPMRKQWIQGDHRKLPTCTDYNSTLKDDETFRIWALNPAIATSRRLFDCCQYKWDSITVSDNNFMQPMRTVDEVSQWFSQSQHSEWRHDPYFGFHERRM